MSRPDDTSPEDRLRRIADEIRAWRRGALQGAEGLDDLTLAAYVIDRLDSLEREKVDDRLAASPELAETINIVREVLRSGEWGTRTWEAELRLRPPQAARVRPPVEARVPARPAEPWAEQPLEAPRSRLWPLLTSRLAGLLAAAVVLCLVGALLLHTLSRGQQAARETTCRNNLSQIYKAARLYTNSYGDQLPDLFAGLGHQDHVERYRKSHYARSTDASGKEVPAGLWLLYTQGYAQSRDVFYCPNTPARLKYGGSENPTVNDLPQMVGYAYNYFPAASPTSKPLLPPPGRLALHRVSNVITQPRDERFCALLADLFFHSQEQPHAERGGMNCCYWEGSIQWLSLKRIDIPWNASQNGARVFSDDLAGSEAVRDTWVLLSQSRR